MPPGVLLVFERTLIIFLVIVAGWLSRRWGLLDGCTTTKLSEFVVDLTFPALVFTSLLRTLDPQALRLTWFVPVLGVVVPLLGHVMGYIAALALAAPGAPRRTAAFTVAFPNWLFIPLPIAMALYGARGETVVLLFNAGALLMLWTLGVWTVKGGRIDFSSLRSLARNPGFIATIAGAAVALALPGARGLESASLASDGFVASSLGVAVQALALLGSLTVPLSLAITGSQLAGLPVTPGMPNRAEVGVTLLRLAAVPLAVVGIFWGAGVLGMPADPVVVIVTVLISGMPVAVTCAIFAERYGGDIPLASRTILYSTVASLATLPLLYWAVERLT